jgi:hypothetical protein
MAGNDCPLATESISIETKKGVELFLDSTTNAVWKACQNKGLFLEVTSCSTPDAPIGYRYGSEPPKILSQVV